MSIFATGRGWWVLARLWIAHIHVRSNLQILPRTWKGAINTPIFRAQQGDAVLSVTPQAVNLGLQIPQDNLCSCITCSWLCVCLKLGSENLLLLVLLQIGAKDFSVPGKVCSTCLSFTLLEDLISTFSLVPAGWTAGLLDCWHPWLVLANIYTEKSEKFLNSKNYDNFSKGQSYWGGMSLKTKIPKSS